MFIVAIVSPYIGAGNFEVTVLQILSLKISVLSRILDAEKFALDSEYRPVTKMNWHPNFLMYLFNMMMQHIMAYLLSPIYIAATGVLMSSLI